MAHCISLYITFLDFFLLFEPCIVYGNICGIWGPQIIFFLVMYILDSYLMSKTINLFLKFIIGALFEIEEFDWCFV